MVHLVMMFFGFTFDCFRCLYFSFFLKMWFLSGDVSSTMGFRTIGTLTNHRRNTSRTSGAQLRLIWIYVLQEVIFFQIHPVMKRSNNKSLQGSYCWFFINQLNHLLHMWIRMKHGIWSRNQPGATAVFLKYKTVLYSQPVSVTGWAVPTY